MTSRLVERLERAEVALVAGDREAAITELIAGSRSSRSPQLAQLVEDLSAIEPRGLAEKLAKKLPEELAAAVGWWRSLVAENDPRVTSYLHAPIAIGLRSLGLQTANLAYVLTADPRGQLTHLVIEASTATDRTIDGLALDDLAALLREAPIATVELVVTAAQRDWLEPRVTTVVVAAPRRPSLTVTVGCFEHATVDRSADRVRTHRSAGAHCRLSLDGRARVVRDAIAAHLVASSSPTRRPRFLFALRATSSMHACQSATLSKSRLPRSSACSSRRLSAPFDASTSPFCSLSPIPIVRGFIPKCAISATYSALNGLLLPSTRATRSSTIRWVVAVELSV